MGCPLCVTVAEYAAGDLIKHILSDHPHEAALMSGSIPLLVAAAKGEWFWVLLGLVVAALVIDDLQRRKAQARQIANATWQSPSFPPSPVVYVPVADVNSPIYRPYFPHRFYETPYTIVH